MNYHHPKSVFNIAAALHEKKFQLIFLCALFFAAGNNNAIAAFVTFNGDSAAESNWQLAAGNTILENFESYSEGTKISSLPTLGISFDLLAGGGYPQAYSFGGTPHGPMHLGNFPNGINAINQYDDIVLHVLPGYAINALGFWNGDGQSDTLIATAYDASNNILGSVGSFKGTFAGFVSDVAISRVVFGGNTGDGWNHLDGLQTNASIVPVPAASWLFLSGIIGLLRYRRRS